MLSRRHIRETAVQFLYLADFEDDPKAADMQEAFWEMIQESSLKKLNQAKAKAILHVAQGRNSRITKLIDQANKRQAELKASDNSGQLVSALNSIISQEEQLSNAIESLKSSAQRRNGDSVPDEKIQDVINADQNLAGLRAAWHQALEHLPSVQNNVESITSSINHLQRISERLEAIEDPESTIGDFAHLREGRAELSALRKETQALVTNILQHKESIDQSLAGVIENYAPERVDPVDRAILRLATFELQNCADIPRAVAINEAIEIARKFGTQDSARFINGVLDAL